MIIVEDGSGVPGANSYVTREYVREFASSRGSELPNDDEELDVLIINAFDYIETFDYKGDREYPGTAWPRSHVKIYEVPFPDDEIPETLRKAQAQATVEVLNSDLMPNPSLSIKKEKVDVIEVEYQQASPEGVEVSFPKVEAFLKPLLRTPSGLRVRVVRA